MIYLLIAVLLALLPASLLQAESIDTEILLSRTDQSDVRIRAVGTVQSNRRRCIPELSVRRDGRTLRATIESCRGPVALLRMHGELTIAVELPRSWRGDVELSTASGNITVEEADDLVRFAARVSSGRIDLGEVAADQADLRTSSGEIRANSITATRVRLDASSGNISLHRIEGTVEAELSSQDLRLDFTGRRGRVEAESASGLLLIENLDGSVDLDVSSGDIRVSFAEFRENSRIESASGNIGVGVPENARFDVELSTASGDIRVDFPMTHQGSIEDDRVSGSVQGGGPILEIETRSGNMHVEPRN